MKIFAASAGGLRPKDTRGHFFLPEEGGFGAFSVSSARGFLSGRSVALRLNTSEKTENSYIRRFCFAFWDFASGAFEGWAQELKEKFNLKPNGD